MGGAIDLYRGLGTSSGYAGPLGLLGGKPDNESYAQWGLNAGTGGVQGLIGDPLGKHIKAKQAAQDAAKRRQAEMSKQDAIDANIKQLNEQYGVGDSAEAHQNHGAIEAWLGGYQGDLQAQGTADVGHQKARDDLSTRQQLAGQGLLGGSVDVQARRTALKNYVANRQKVVAGAASQRQGLSNQLETQRSNLATQFAAGSSASPTWQGVSDQQHQLLDSARDNIVPSAIGNSLTTAGSLYYQDQTARGNGGQGFRWGGGGSGSGSSTGSIS